MKERFNKICEHLVKNRTYKELAYDLLSVVFLAVGVAFVINCFDSIGSINIAVYIILAIACYTGYIVFDRKRVDAIVDMVDGRYSRDDRIRYRVVKVDDLNNLLDGNMVRVMIIESNRPLDVEENDIGYKVSMQ